MALTLGIDIGSTTAKAVLFSDGAVIFEKYERHFSAVREKCGELVQQLLPLTGGAPVSVAVSGSAGLGLANACGLPFVQEVYATSKIVEKQEPDARCVIELGGEDAKIIFFDGGVDERMNGSCAGGTGAFIDQMATLLDVSVDELDRLSLEAEKIYPIASRCGVFAKTDIQPLLNQGAKKSDLAMSIYKAVVNQTIAGLAQGKRIRGKVLFLGGPLYYCKGLQRAFAETLELSGTDAVFPEYARYAVAAGAALYAAEHGEVLTGEALLDRIRNAAPVKSAETLEPLFACVEDYGAFRARHEKDSVRRRPIESYTGSAWLGIDCGSTTTKLALISEDCELLYTYYASNRGNPVEIVREQLAALYAACGGRIRIAGSAVTGYGEELIKNAFSVDFGLVETIAHYTAAKHFMPEVDFILDIGGQDIKCFRIRNGAIDSIMLNEACSSGCGSFLETFAKSLGCPIEDFANRGLFAKHPVNLGSRCTVFMNSSVKQSQKDGATIEDISAGLSVSVVKNALYKVIRATDAAALGARVVVQGGTNQCHITINTFSDGGRFVSGNRCERGAGQKTAASPLPNLYEYKRKTLETFGSVPGTRGVIGLPRALGMYELLPLWHTLFTRLGFGVTVSPASSRRLYEKGQFSIPSDTACYPAKLMHGHIMELLEAGTDAIFYPCLTYNVDEKSTDNHYNCPVVAYYSELLRGNVDELQNTRFLCPYLSLESPRELARELYTCLAGAFPEAGLTRRAVEKAAREAFAAYRAFEAGVRAEGERAVAEARKRGARIMVLAGRPYHIDGEICHGIDQLAATLGFCVVSEDSVCHLTEPVPVRVLNQWTYHARLYRAAHYAVEHADTELVQLVSFGCGVDAITTDEVRDILERGGKFYTQLKIDEITNLGAVKIRLRSLLGALEERRERT